MLCLLSISDSLSKSKNHLSPILTQGENKSFQCSVMPYQVFRFAIEVKIRFWFEPVSKRIGEGLGEHFQEYRLQKVSIKGFTYQNTYTTASGNLD